MQKSFEQILQQYKVNAFWDTPLESIDQHRHREFVTERLLDYGGMDGVRWLFENYGAEAIKEVLISSRRISRVTATFWAIYFSIPPEKIRCLSEQMLFPAR